MSIAKETAIAVPALTVVLFVSHIFFGPDESYREFTIGPRTWLGVAVPDARFIAKDLMTGRASKVEADPDSASPEQMPPSELTPHARIRGVFAQFMTNGRPPAT